MNIRQNFSLTRKACYIGYVVQAVSINFLPLLFLTFAHTFAISLAEISLLIGINFAMQLAVDFFSTFFLPRVNLRGAVIVAHLFAALGLIGVATLPYLTTHPFVGLLIAVLCCGVGGGLTEVLISPLCEACNEGETSASMSLLHSFYCWGQAGVILLSVLFFAVFGVEHWRILSLILALIPIGNALLFSLVPLRTPGGEEGGAPLSNFVRRPVFLWLLLMMAMAGAAEMVMNQWASSFAESGLGVSKTVGDLLGPCLFALLMGAARLLHAKCAVRFPLLPLLAASSVLCIAAYLLAALATLPILALVGCGLCGFSVGIFWPGVYSAAAGELPDGGVSMYSFLALAGDVGCLLGPSLAGAIADANGGDLRAAFLPAAFLPLLMLVAVARVARLHSKKK